MNYFRFTDTDKEANNDWIDIVENNNIKELKKHFIQFSFGCDDLLKGFYNLLGWRYNIKHLCKKFLVKYKYNDYWIEYFAPNKTCLYNAIGGKHKIIDIVEIK